MKKLLYLFALLFIMASCDKGINPSDSIGLNAAFAHCSHSVGYWVCGIAATVFALAMVLLMYLADDWNGKLLAGLAILVLFAWCMRPAELAWSTTVEQAARGVWIGY